MLSLRLLTNVLQYEIEIDKVMNLSQLQAPKHQSYRSYPLKEVHFFLLGFDLTRVKLTNECQNITGECRGKETRISLLAQAYNPNHSGD